MPYSPTYCVDYPSYEQRFKNVTGQDPKEADTSTFNPVQYHSRMSQVGDRWTVDGIDNVVARKLFATKNADNVESPSEPIIDRYNQIQHDEIMQTAISGVFVNAGRSGSPEARTLIADFMDKFGHNIGQQNMGKIVKQTPGLADAIVERHFNGKARFMCPDCNHVINAGADTMEEPQKEQMVCAVCQQKNGKLAWFMAYHNVFGLSSSWVSPTW